MIRALLRWFGYVSIDYGVSCGRHWVEIDGKVIAQTSGDDLWMKDNDVRRLAMVVAPGCLWQAEKDDEWFIQSVKSRWPWHDHEAIIAAKNGTWELPEMTAEQQHDKDRDEAPRIGSGYRDWEWAAHRLGEMMCADGPKGYYLFTPQQLVDWASSLPSRTVPETQPREGDDHPGPIAPLKGDTPRTDARWNELYDRGGNTITWFEVAERVRDFARQLERKLASKTRDADHFFQLSGRYLEELNAVQSASGHPFDFRGYTTTNTSAAEPVSTTQERKA